MGEGGIAAGRRFAARFHASWGDPPPRRGGRGGEPTVIPEGVPSLTHTTAAIRARCAVLSRSCVVSARAGCDGLPHGVLAFLLAYVPRLSTAFHSYQHAVRLNWKPIAPDAHAGGGMGSAAALRRALMGATGAAPGLMAGRPGG